MSTFKKGLFGLITFMAMGIVMIVSTVTAYADDWINVVRMYNPNSGEHFYTMSTNERNSLYLIGWHYEGVSWAAPSTGDTIYRVYNPNNGDHHYTMSLGEKDHLVKVGWRYEGTAWKSADSKGTPIYRVYNPNAKGPGSHLYTADVNEKNVLSKSGWKYEGIAWYAAGLQSGNISPLPTKPGNTQDDENKSGLVGTIQDGLDWSNPH
ncbi:hypothetical protein [uncultured Enterococcus sp.]|uniref:hypothetical protein n=1 Tax=uncultured Enterococcus sp. TaxID=167972 RepID=UPI0025F6EA45|nr:hypothetical protein [uncultured Enterococcus sp.]